MFLLGNRTISRVAATHTAFMTLPSEAVYSTVAAAKEALNHGHLSTDHPKPVSVQVLLLGLLSEQCVMNETGIRGGCCPNR